MASVPRAFAKPEINEALEERDVKYAIRNPGRFVYQYSPLPGVLHRIRRASSGGPAVVVGLNLHLDQ